MKERNKAREKRKKEKKSSHWQSQSMSQVKQDTGRKYCVLHISFQQSTSEKKKRVSVTISFPPKTLIYPTAPALRNCCTKLQRLRERERERKRKRE